MFGGEYSIMKYRFWGWEHADAKAITAEYKGIETPVDLYDALSGVRIPVRRG